MNEQWAKTCTRHGPYGGLGCPQCFIEQRQIVSKMMESAMKQPTQEQLNDPAWWDENAGTASHYCPTNKQFYDSRLHPCCFARPAKPAAPESKNPENQYLMRVECPMHGTHIGVTACPRCKDAATPSKAERLARHLAERDAYLAEDEAPEWDGEGARPPVNAAFEFSANGQSWEERVMLFDDGITCLMAHRKYPANRWHYKVDDPGWDCRPIRSKEQREREEVCAEAVKVAHMATKHFGISGQIPMASIMTALYDAGLLRKGGE